MLKFKFTCDTLKPITSYDKIITFLLLLLLRGISCDQKMRKVRDKEIRDRTSPGDYCLNLQPNAIVVSRVSETKWLSVAMNMNESSRSKARNKIISTFAALLCCFTFSQNTWDYFPKARRNSDGAVWGRDEFDAKMTFLWIFVESSLRYILK